MINQTRPERQPNSPLPVGGQPQRGEAMARSTQRILIRPVALAACLVGMLAVAAAPGVAASAAGGRSGVALDVLASRVLASRVLASPGLAGPGLAGPDVAPGFGYAPAGKNLLANPGAQAGAASAQGWDSVTIPGWQVGRGLPTVVRYGTHGFPAAAGPFPARRGGQLFSGGVGGTAVLRQRVPLRSPSGRPLRPGAGYELSAWLGGTATSLASLTVRFLSSAGRLLGSQAIGPVGGRKQAGRARLSRRSAVGKLPAGTASAQFRLVLATSATNWDGPNGANVGYDRAIADGLRFSVRVPVLRPRTLLRPAAHVPHYQHVFLFYFENQDFQRLIGNTRQAPYLNCLLPRSSLLANLYAEEHPSDGNYLALAGGSTFGVPLTDPLEENPLYTIRARSIGSLLDAAHLSWKGYLQSASGPCDDTVHGQYWDDDLPLLYFAGIRDRPAYCAAHVVPLESLSADLAKAATTPNFAWISPNDCSDMEGCGIRAGDRFLARELGSILRSPAWRTQRSLAIITVDEDNYDRPDPPQRVATIMLASSGVRSGYVSRVRYTHYSLLRTIEAALRTGGLTANDRYAQPVNDVFRTGSSTAASWPGRGRAAGLSHTGMTGAGSAHGPIPTAFVVNSGAGTVTPIDLTTRRAGKPIKVGADPTAIAAAPDGRTVYVANSGSGTVTPIDVSTLRPGRPIKVGADPRAIVVTPDGRTVYVASSGSGTVTPISASAWQAGPPIAVGAQPRAIGLTPNGKTAYVLDWGSAQATPISTGTNRAGPPIRVGSYPVAISFGPDGATGYVASFGSGTVTPIAVATGRAGPPIRVGRAPDAIAVTPDGRTVYVVNGDSESVTPIAAASERAGRGITVGYSPAAVAISRSGATAYVVNTISGTVTPIVTASGRRGKPISVGSYSYPLVIAIAPAGATAVVLDTYSGQVSLIDTRTGHAFAPITVGAFPSAVAITG